MEKTNTTTTLYTIETAAATAEAIKAAAKREAAKAAQARRMADKAHRAEVAAALAEGDTDTADTLRADYGPTAWAEVEQTAAAYLAHLAKVREDYKAAQAAAEAIKATGDTEAIKAAVAARKAAWRAMYEAENTMPGEYFTIQTAAAIRKAADPTAKTAAKRDGKAGKDRPQGEQTATMQTATGEAVAIVTGGRVSDSGMGAVERRLAPDMFAALSSLEEARRLFNSASALRMPTGRGRDIFARSVSVADTLRAEADRLARRAEKTTDTAEARRLYAAAADKRAEAIKATADLERAYTLLSDTLPDGVDLYNTAIVSALEEAAAAAEREAVPVSALPSDWMEAEYTRTRLARKVYGPDETDRQYRDETVNPGRMVARSVSAAIEAARSARVDTAAGFVCVSLCDLLNDHGEDIACVKYPAYMAATSAAAEGVFSAVDGEQTARYGDLCEAFAAAVNLTPTEAAIVARRFRGQTWEHICSAMGYKDSHTLRRHRAAIEAKALSAGYGTAAIRAIIAERDGMAAQAKADRAAAALAEAAAEAAAADTARRLAAATEAHGLAEVEARRLVDIARDTEAAADLAAAAVALAKADRAAAALLSAAAEADRAEADRAAARKAAQAAASVSCGSAAVVVVCMDEAGRVLAEYASIGDAAKATGASKGAISQAVKGARKTAAGYRWAKA